MSLSFHEHWNCTIMCKHSFFNFVQAMQVTTKNRINYYNPTVFSEALLGKNSDNRHGLEKIMTQLRTDEMLTINDMKMG